MHTNPAFRRETDARNLAFLQERGFGMLAVSVDGAAPLVSHVPFSIDAAGATVELHLARPNPILKRLPAAAVIAATGPDGYVSPDWYDLDDQVPTWNYVAVHVRGRLSVLPHEEMRAMLDRQSADYEGRLPKRPWTTDKMTPAVLDRMLRAIVPCRLAVERIDATWKLSQNKPDAVRLAAAGPVERGIGHELGDLSALMRSG